MSGTYLVSQLGQGGRDAPGVSWVEAGEAANTLRCTGRPLAMQSDLAQNVSSVEGKKP